MSLVKEAYQAGYEYYKLAQTPEASPEVAQGMRDAFSGKSSGSFLGNAWQGIKDAFSGPTASEAATGFSRIGKGDKRKPGEGGGQQAVGIGSGQ